jgi:glycosyltransferase involved in cell wall biosynthesis
MPRVTVITATYNWSTVLPFAIASVLAQTFTDFEMLVIGDGCTDESEEVVTAIDDPRVRWINIPRFGHQAGPNNEGLRQARGEFIAYLGHDDLWLPHHLEVVVKALADVDIAHTIIASVFPDGSVLPKSMVPSCTAHRRALTERIGGWRDYRELVTAPERELWARATASGAKSVVLPRLTGIKLPAGRRANVYRDRPFHEQAAWLERIRTEPDLEVTMLGGSVLPFSGPETTRARWRRFLARPWQWPAILWRRLNRRKGSEIARTVRFKGVPD